jgi:signal peptidase I
MAPLLRRIADAALTVGAVLGALALLLGAAGVLFGVRPLFFRSGSMAPTIGTGALGLARSVPADDLQPGDVVSVRTPSGTRVTHRVVSAESSAGGVLLILKGDANRVADPETYPASSAYRVFWHVPWVGYVVGAMLSPAGFFVLGLSVMSLLVLATSRGTGPPAGGRRVRRGSPRSPGHRAHRATATVVAVVAVSVGPGQIGSASAAAWTDDVAVSGAVMTAKTVPAPVVSCGTLNVGSTTLTWTAVSGATGYTLHYGSGGATTETVGAAVTSKTFSGIATSGVFSVQANINYGSTTWTSVASNAKNYTVVLVAVGICTSA